MALHPLSKSARWFNGESLRAALAVLATLAGLALMLHALLDSEPMVARLSPALTPGAPLALPLVSPLVSAEPASL